MEIVKFTITHINYLLYSQTEICYIVLCAFLMTPRNMHQKFYNVNVLSVQKNNQQKTATSNFNENQEKK